MQQELGSVLPDLHPLTVLAQTQSFTRTAQRLGISKGLVSAHIAKLEKSIGVPLVRRTTRSVVLTEAGSRLAQDREVRAGRQPPLRRQHRKTGRKANPCPDCRQRHTEAGRTLQEPGQYKALTDPLYDKAHPKKGAKHYQPKDFDFDVDYDLESSTCLCPEGKSLYPNGANCNHKA